MKIPATERKHLSTLDAPHKATHSQILIESVSQGVVAKVDNSQTSRVPSLGSISLRSYVFVVGQGQVAGRAIPISPSDDHNFQLGGSSK